MTHIHVRRPPFRPTLTVGTNTEARVRQALDREHPGSEGEARWNFAFWLQNQLAIVADSEMDSPGAALRERWLQDEGLWLPEEVRDDEDAWQTVNELGGQVTERFVRLCADTARRLHSAGTIESTFGRPVPVVIHELEYYEEIARQTVDANPQGVADDFGAWVRALG